MEYPPPGESSPRDLMKEPSMRSPEPEDEALVAHAVTGDHDAFASLVRRHEDAVFAMLYRQTGDDEISRDLAQEAFVRAFRFLGSFKGKSSFKTWLTRIAMNVSHSYFDSRTYRERRRAEPFESEKHDSSLDVREDLDHQERLQTVRHLIAELSAPLRDAVVLVALEGKSYAEAAETLGIPPGTVASRLNKALETLRRRVVEEGL